MQLGLVLVRTLKEKRQFFLTERIALFLDVEAEKSCEQQPVFVVHRTVAALIHESCQSVDQRSNLKRDNRMLTNHEENENATTQHVRYATDLCIFQVRVFDASGRKKRCVWNANH